MLRYVVVGVICLLAGSARAQQTPPSPQGAPASPSSAAPVNPSKAVVVMEEPLPGDHWTYEVRDEITGKVSVTREYVVTEVTPKEISVRFKNLGTPTEGFNVFDRSWNMTSAGQWKYSPNDGTGVKTPLAVGKTWAFQSNDINAGEGFGWNRSGKSKIVGQESMTTQAGTFETYRIETTYSSRNIKDPTRKEEIVMQTWYVPAIDHWVKRTFTSRVEKHLRVNNAIELIGYGRKQ
jgi:hypothetical protein